jgi:hypothetical protein
MTTSRTRFSLLISTVVCCCLDASVSHGQAPFISPKFPNLVSPCLGVPVVLQDLSNTAAVQNGPAGGLPYFDLTSPACITEIDDYHWNNGAGAVPGTIRIITSGTPANKTRTLLTTKAQGTSPTVNWIGVVVPMQLVPPGNYYIDDSDHSTWSRNTQSSNRFFTTVYGICAPPATGTNCVANKFVAANPSGPAVPSGPMPCHTTTGAPIILDKPGCAGPIGSPMTFTVRAAPVPPIASIRFGPGSLSSSTFVPAGVTKPIPGSTPATSPIAMGPFPVGSTFTVPAPAALCIAGKGNWAWDVWLYDAAGNRHGDVDYFVIENC